MNQWIFDPGSTEQRFVSSSDCSVSPNSTTTVFDVPPQREVGAISPRSKTLSGFVDWRGSSGREVVESAAASAWSGFVSVGEVSSVSSFETLRCFYFSLRGVLYPYSKRRLFTKDECAFFLTRLGFGELPGRRRRQLSQDLNVQLKKAMSEGSHYSIELLQECSRECAASRLGAA
jgi:hypothetical protein